MIKNIPPLKGLDIRVPMILLIKERGLINQGSGLCSAPDNTKVICKDSL